MTKKEEKTLFPKYKYRRKSGTEYKHVALYETKGDELFRAYMAEYGNWEFWTKSLREAAIAVDKKLLENGKQAVNILKKK